MAELKTLKELLSEIDYRRPDIKIVTDTYLKEAAKDWINELENQKDLHATWISRGVGESPDFEYPSGFDRENSYYLPYGYDSIIRWINGFFNLEE